METKLIKAQDGTYFSPTLITTMHVVRESNGWIVKVETSDDFYSITEPEESEENASLMLDILAHRIASVIELE